MAFFAAGGPVQLPCFGFSDVGIMDFRPGCVGLGCPPGSRTIHLGAQVAHAAAVRRRVPAGPGAGSLPTSQWKSGKTTLVAIPPVRLQTCGVLACRPLARGKALVISSWEVGRRIVEFEQGGQGRAEYGTRLLERLSADLRQRFGRGFGVINLRQIRKFHLAWPRSPIRQTLSDESSPARKLLTEPASPPSFPLPWALGRRAATRG